MTTSTDNSVTLEFELTFLAKHIPTEVNGVAPQPMVDVYIPQDPKVLHPNLRLRQRGDKFEITKKTPIDGDASTQTEATIALSTSEFESLRNSSERKVEKDRYKVSIEGHPAEVDVFKGELTGLVLIDFEFDSQEDKQMFVAPECCLADVTQDTFIAGGLLAGKKYAQIKDQLDHYNYQALSLG